LAKVSLYVIEIDKTRATLNQTNRFKLVVLYVTNRFEANQDEVSDLIFVYYQIGFMFEKMDQILFSLSFNYHISSYLTSPI